MRPVLVACGLLAMPLGVVSLAIAQPTCPPLPPPAGPTVEVYPAQASTLRDIVAAAASGTTILLHDGVYALDDGDFASRLSFLTPGVTLRSYSGDRDAVILDGAYQTNELVSIHASDVTLASLTLRRAYDHPIHVSGDPDPITGVWIHDVRIVDPGQQAIKINPVGEGWVDDGIVECSSLELTDAGRTQIRDGCYTGGIDAHRAQGWLVRRNRISGFWCDTGLSEHGVHFWKASRDTVVEENVILDCARGIGFGLGSSGDGRDYPDDPYPGVGYLGHFDGVIRNNFVAAARPELFESQLGFDTGIALEQARGTWVAHNTVASTQAPFSSIEWRWGNTAIEVANNLVTHSLVPRDGGQATLQGNLTNAPTSWLVNVATADLHLTAAAGTARDGGVALPAGVADRDLDLEPRDGAPDVGGDEAMLFGDGFETGSTSRWSARVP